MNRLKKHLEQKKIRVGDKVKWSYTHHLNSKSSIVRVKKGVFISFIRSEEVCGGSRITTSHYGKVHFDGNKNPSRVLVADLVKDNTLKD